MARLVTPLRGTDAPDILRGRRVLVTGVTGFKGAWSAMALHRLGVSVSGFSLGLPSDPSLFAAADVSALLEHDVRGDIRNLDAVRAAIELVDPDLILHMAAQPLVIPAFRDPVATFSTNVGGTWNVLEAARRRGAPRSVLVVTSDKCYADPSSAAGCHEDDALGGREPYAASKAAAELVAGAFRSSYADDLRVATARAGNVIGGGDWAAHRLIPDVVRARTTGTKVEIRQPHAVRPWQHVLEPVFGYLTLAARLLAGDTDVQTAVNFGPDPAALAPVSRVLSFASRSWPVELAMPGGSPSYHEEPVLTLDNSRAKQLLGWTPVWELRTAVQKTMRWYEDHLDGAPARRLCESDLDAYEEHRRAAAPVLSLA